VKYSAAEFVERRKWKPHSRMAKGNDILPRYISTLCLDTIYKVYTFDNSDKSRAVQEDGLAGTSASSRSSNQNVKIRRATLGKNFYVLI